MLKITAYGTEPAYLESLASNLRAANSTTLPWAAVQTVRRVSRVPRSERYLWPVPGTCQLVLLKFRHAPQTYPILADMTPTLAAEFPINHRPHLVVCDMYLDRACRQ